jgi:elongation factor G
VYSGVLTAGSYVTNTTTGEKERIGRIVRMHADKREDIDKVAAGDIAAVVGLSFYLPLLKTTHNRYTHLPPTRQS